MKLVLWDWNGTLLNDAPIIWGIFNEVIQAFGFEAVSFERYQEIYRHPVHLMYEEIGFDLAALPFQQIADRWHEIYEVRSEAAALHDDVLHALDSFSQRGIRQAVLSALPGQVLQRVVAGHGITGFFEQVRGLSDRFAHSKVEAGERLIEELGVDGSEALVIGDSSHDAEVAKALGARCCLVSGGSESLSRLESNGYPVFSRLADVMTYALDR